MPGQAHGTLYKIALVGNV